jgi:murein DD-endopeptidase MepM/ murein hydrolase activator NlpD
VRWCSLAGVAALLAAAGMIAVAAGMIGLAARAGAVTVDAGADEEWRERCPRAGRFGFPVGGGEAAGYYNAQPFGDNRHLGDDWNGNGGGDTDLGDPVLAIAHGVVRSARDHGNGWGNVIRIAHDIGGHGEPIHVESIYAHLDAIEVAAGDVVSLGQRIGTIGTAGGRYRAHLHLEVRDRPDLPLGRGYGADRTGYLDPTAFIRAHR